MKSGPREEVGLTKAPLCKSGPWIGTELSGHCTGPCQMSLVSLAFVTPLIAGHLTWRKISTGR